MNRKIIISIKIFISIALLWFLIRSAKLDFSLLPDLIFSPATLFFTIILYFIIVAISSWRWHQLNTAQGIQLSYSRTILPTYLGIAFNNILPGGVGGDFFRFYFLNKHIPTKKSVVMLSILLDRITGLLGIFITVGMIAAFNLRNFSDQKITLYFIFTSLALCTSLILLYFISKLLPQKMGVSNWLSNKFGEKRCPKSLLSLLEGIHVYRNSKKILIGCLTASVVIQILIATTCMLIAKMMHFPSISFSDYIIAIALTQIVNLAPIAPGGFGIGEIAFANTLALLNPGIGSTYATIFLAYRIIGFVTYLPGISVFIFEGHNLKQVNAFDEREATTLQN
jgi:uncharacterized protein (TIRG00374 family)